MLFTLKHVCHLSHSSCWICSSKKLFLKYVSFPFAVTSVLRKSICNGNFSWKRGVVRPPLTEQRPDSCPWPSLPTSYSLVPSLSIADIEGKEYCMQWQLASSTLRAGWSSRYAASSRMCRRRCPSQSSGLSNESQPLSKCVLTSSAHLYCQRLALVPLDR